MREERINCLKEGEVGEGPILYWMQRDQRIEDNWALLYAQELAEDQPICVLFVVDKKSELVSDRQYPIMKEGLKEVCAGLKALGIGFMFKEGNPVEIVAREAKKCGALITDFNPLRSKQKWNRAVARKVKCPFFEVDAHNIVPVWEASGKLEYGAYTIRPKIKRKLPVFLEDFPRMRKAKSRWKGKYPQITGKASIPCGPKAAKRQLSKFLSKGLSQYAKKRNDPTCDAQSNLSMHLHFGHIAPQRVALEVKKQRATGGKEDFLEELIVRRELSDNYCYYNPDYDSIKGCPDWAQKTLKKHAKDKREHVYGKKVLEEGRTHDPLWNAAQLQMVETGKMHGYMRMYWAKKLLEWTSSPEQALKIGIELNDKYELDGCDPNGYVGVAWSVGGVHDRAWTERPIFGKIRYMNDKGCARKFDVEQYQEQAM